LYLFLDFDGLGERCGDFTERFRLVLMDFRLKY